MSSLLIRGGRVVSPADGLDGVMDVLAEGPVIRQIGPRIETRADVVLDASGQIVAPGLIDLHCHLREPGLPAETSGETAETLETGLAAAVAGGFTSVCAMPNTQPVNDNAQATEAMTAKARIVGLARLFPIAAVTVGSEGESLTDFRALVAAGAVAFSDDGRPVATAELMRMALDRARALGVPIIDHCEDPALSAGGALADGPIARRLGVKGIPASSEETCLQRDLELAEATGAHFHAAHLSTAGSIALVRAAMRQGVNVTCEVTPHHFTLSDEAVLQHGTNAKMNPPLRSSEDLAAIRAAIADGTVDVIATDHAPHAPELKAKPLAEAPFGVTGFETALALALTELVHPGIISLPRLISLMSTNPARVIRQRLGRLEVGVPADITIFDPNLEWTYRVAESRSKSRNSPFDGRQFRGGMTTTIVAGKVVYRRRNRES
jgi:dihydroorotase